MSIIPNFYTRVLNYKKAKTVSIPTPYLFLTYTTKDTNLLILLIIFYASNASSKIICG